MSRRPPPLDTVPSTPPAPPTARRVLRSSTFRLALIYAALFGASAAAILGFVYWNTAVFVAKQTDETIQIEITGLAERYGEEGIRGLRRIIEARSKDQRKSLYLLTLPNRRPMAGNLDSWPDAASNAVSEATSDTAGWMEFTYRRPVGDHIATHHARARYFRLVGGFNLLVGHDVQDHVELERRLRHSMIAAVLLTLALGLGGGLLVSRAWLGRLETINRAAGEIIGGDLTRRIPTGTSNDEVDRLAGNLNDMLDRIERLMAGMRQVTDNVAHDLRGPLNRLRSRLEVTLLEDPDQAAYRAALEETVVEAESLLNVFNALLLIGEAEAGMPAAEMNPVDLAELVRDAAELYEPVAADRGIAFASSLADGAIVTGNRDLLFQALANLIDNALKYTPRGGRVGIAVATDTKTASVGVTDDGPGIPDADRPRVLDRFVRLEASRNSPGSGLGLSTVAAVAKLHRAELTLEDAAPGLRVRLAFPLIAHNV